MIIIQTNYGNITLELYEKAAPKTVVNFLQYVDSGHYAGTTFHRVIKGCVIQGGGYTQDLKRKITQDPIENEATNRLKNLRGTIAMARREIVHSATSQFFINIADNPYLDHKGPNQDQFGYCVFGKVVEGMDVVDKISNVSTGTFDSFRNVPLEAVVIHSITRQPLKG